MFEKLETLGSLIKRGAQKENRPMFLIVIALVMVGAIIALGANFPILSPFLYAMF